MDILPLMQFQKTSEASDKQIELFGRSMTVDNTIKIIKSKPDDIDLDDYISQLKQAAELIKTAGL